MQLAECASPGLVSGVGQKSCTVGYKVTVERNVGHLHEGLLGVASWLTKTSNLFRALFTRMAGKLLR